MCCLCLIVSLLVVFVMIDILFDCILIPLCFAAMKFHYHLGQLLYQFCDGNDDVGDTILLTASQINHGKEWIMKDKDLSIGIAELNMKAGKKALDGCDHKTAYSYFMFAVSLLPEGHWESHYDLSLRLNFLMAGAANSCCQYDEAVQLTRRGLSNARCFEDQLPLYLLLSQSKWSHVAFILFFILLTSINLTILPQFFKRRAK